MAEPRRRRNTMTAELPHDILFCNILPRLPGKSLLCFMCVSKQWHSILRTPMFAEMHRHHATNTDHHKLLVFSTTTSTPCFYTIDCETPEDGSTSSRSFPFEFTPKNMTVLTSFGGLVCVGITDRKSIYYSDLILWNPLTGDYKTLSKPNSTKECYNRTRNLYGLCYISSEDDYKIVHLIGDLDAYIYSLKSDTWRKIGPTEDLTGDTIHIVYLNRGNRGVWCACVSLNEKLYFLKYDSRRSYTIVRFDTKTEKFKEIATPPYGNQKIMCLSFTGQRGRIHFSVIYSVVKANFREWRFEVWRMDGDGEWTKVVTYPVPSSYIDQPMQLLRTGNWLTYSNVTRFVYKINSAMHTKEKLCSYNGD